MSLSWVSRFSYCYAEDLKAQCHYADCCDAECRYVDCCSAEYRHAESRGAHKGVIKGLKN